MVYTPVRTPFESDSPETMNVGSLCSWFEFRQAMAIARSGSRSNKGFAKDMCFHLFFQRVFRGCATRHPYHLRQNGGIMASWEICLTSRAMELPRYTSRLAAPAIQHGACRTHVMLILYRSHRNANKRCRRWS